MIQNQIQQNQVNMAYVERAAGQSIIEKALLLQRIDQLTNEVQQLKDEISRLKEQST